VAEATIGALLDNGNPVALPSDSIEKLGPVLAALGPVVAPAGTFTFDVVPEFVQAAPDGTQATARAAQLTVTQHLGQTTVTFGLGYARAGARTIVNEPLSSDGGAGLGNGLGGLPPSPSESAAPESGASQSGASQSGPSQSDSMNPDTAGPDTAGPPVTAGLPSSALTALSPPPTVPGASIGPLPASVSGPVSAAAPMRDRTATPVPDGSAAPVLPSAAPATALASGPAGPSKGTVALLGVICAAILIRYLSYSAKLRRP
jgi:hypothetical protein